MRLIEPLTDLELSMLLRAGQAFASQPHGKLETDALGRACNKLVKSRYIGQRMPLAVSRVDTLKLWRAALTMPDTGAVARFRHELVAAGVIDF